MTDLKDEVDEAYNALSNADKKSIDQLRSSIGAYDISKLMILIQPLWNKAHLEPEKITDLESVKLMVGIYEYKNRGLDMEYLTKGAGAPGNCTLL